MRDRELGINIHEEWIGMTQPVGLVVEPTVLDRFGILRLQILDGLTQQEEGRGVCTRRHRGPKRGKEEEPCVRNPSCC